MEDSETTEKNLVTEMFSNGVGEEDGAGLGSPIPQHPTYLTAGE